MGLFSRALDAVDNAITDTVTRAGAHREAERFARQVRPGETWYSVETYALPTGEQQLLKEHTFDRIKKSGHRSAEGVYLNSGPLFRRRPAGMQTEQEYSNSEVAGPDAGKAVEQPKRSGLFGRKAA